MVRTYDVTKSVETPAEYRDAIDAAETLGLELARIEFRGTHEFRDTGYSERLRNVEISDRNGGKSSGDWVDFEARRKWFRAYVDGDRHDLRPVRDTVGDRDGEVRLHFRS